MRRHTLDAAVSPRGVDAEVGLMMSGALRVAGKLMLFNDLTAVLVFLATRDHQSAPVLTPIVDLRFASRMGMVNEGSFFMTLH